jgi:hypothetical protein
MKTAGRVGGTTFQNKKNVRLVREDGVRSTVVVAEPVVLVPTPVASPPWVVVPQGVVWDVTLDVVICVCVLSWVVRRFR